MRGACARIDLGALRANFALARRLPATRRGRCFAVIKANAYGHGLSEVATALRDRADGFAVARLDEALTLRDAGVNEPLLLLEGVLGATDLRCAARHRLQIAIHHQHQVDELCRTTLPRPLHVWLKIDSGMHRLGFSPEQAEPVWRRLRAAAQVERVDWFTHFSNADDPRDAMTGRQIERFRRTVDALDPGRLGERSLANSAALLDRTDAHDDWQRPGLMLYGVSPFAERGAAALGLTPVMTLSAPLISVKQLAADEPVGYGGDWRCPQPMPVGVVAIGYGDGYPRALPSGAPLLINGARAALVGRVSMDMITVDLRSQPRAKPGDEVILWGRDLPVERLAALAGTIPYTLLTGVSARVHRHYTYDTNRE